MPIENTTRHNINAFAHNRRQQWVSAPVNSNHMVEIDNRFPALGVFPEAIPRGLELGNIFACEFAFYHQAAFIRGVHKANSFVITGALCNRSALVTTTSDTEHLSKALGFNPRTKFRTVDRVCESCERVSERGFARASRHLKQLSRIVERIAFQELHYKQESGEDGQ